jgi:hypothetical protein
MAERLSTGLRNWLLGSGSVREAFDDCVMKIYSGAAPDEADDAISGNLLVTITKASGTVSTGTWAAGTTERSSRNEWKLVLDGDHASGNTCIAHVHVEGDAGTTYTYTNTPDLDANGVARAVAKMLQETPSLNAVAAEDATNTIYVAAKIAGVELVITDGGGNVTITPTESKAESRSDAMYFALPASGAMSKASEVWSGLVATTGVAGYFRLVQPFDDGTDSATAIRLQGSVSTSGAELNLSSTSLVATTTLTIDTFSISLPAE